MEKRKRKRSYKRIVNFLSCLVVFCTTYALILPAATQEVEARDVYCDQEEHIHTTECYTSDDPLCAKEEAPVQKAHTHSEDCYSVSKDLICEDTSEEHEHNDACYEEVKTLTCTKEESEEDQGHVHAPNCYVSNELLCDQEEHTHSRECESNHSLTEEKSDWEDSLPEELDKDLNTRMVQIAKSQLGYEEVKDNFEIVNGSEKYYTRYGEWYGKPYEDWNTMFASFVLRYAGVSKQEIPYGHDWNDWIDDLNKKELFEAKEYEPVVGDLVFFKDLEKEDVPNQVIKSYVGIVSEVKEDKPIKAIVGDFKDKVDEVTINEKDYEILAYIHPETSDLSVDEIEEPKEETKDKDEDPKFVIQDEEDSDTEDKTEDADGAKNDGSDEEAKDSSEVDPDAETEDKTEQDKEQKVAYRLPEQFVVENEDFTLILKPQMYGDQSYNVYSVADSAEESTDDASTKEEVEETQSQNGVKMKSKVVMSEETSDNIQDKIDNETSLSADDLNQIIEDKKEAEVNYQELPVPTVTIEKVAANTDAETQQLEQQVTEATEGEDVLFTAYYRIVAYVGDQEIDLFENTRFDVELIPTQKFVDTYDTTQDLEDVKPEAEVGAKLRLFTPSSNSQSTSATPIHASSKLVPVFKLQTSSLNEDEPNTDVELGSDEYPTATMSDNILAFAAVDQTNPNFTVQTWAKLKRVKLDTDTGTHNLKIYDQSTNNNNTILKYADIKNGEFVTEDYYSEIYKNQQDLEYHKYPELKYFNLLANNGDYQLKEVWVLKEGKNSTSDKKDDWEVFSYSVENPLVFTNNEAHKNDPNTIVIKQNTVIRLMYEPKAGSFASPANFYDYDITKDGTWTNGGYNGDKGYAGSRETAYGINSYINYTSRYGNDGISKKYMLGFGNQNTGVGLKVQKGFNSVNDGTDNTYDGTNKYVDINATGNPAFGIVGDSLDKNGNLIYHNNIAAPNLFEEGSATGKTNYKGTLSFKQFGDTYTITSATVNGNTLSGLDQFTNLGSLGTQVPHIVKIGHKYFWTNNFWPMDKITGKDPHTGGEVFQYNKTNQWVSTNTYRSTGRLGTYSQEGLWNGPTTNYTYYYPASDDAKPHNNMFGMTYEIEFTLDDMYTGPLEYFFYGDDDLWAYLTYPDGTTKKIADLGGVHSTIGSRVNLRDSYIKEDPLKEDASLAGTYKLKIFYTERGLSGSSCYLQFNLPNVTGKQTGTSTQTVTLTKETSDSDMTVPYDFTVNITGAGSTEIDEFSYVIQRNDKTTFGGVLQNGSKISLRKDETIAINGLPSGARVTFTEILSDSEPFTVYTWLNGNSTGSENSKKSITTTQDGDSVYFKNVRLYTLPETGGIGISSSIIAGGASVMTTSIYLIGVNRKGRWRSKKK